MGSARPDGLGRAGRNKCAMADMPKGVQHAYRRNRSATAPLRYLRTRLDKAANRTPTVRAEDQGGNASAGVGLNRSFAFFSFAFFESKTVFRKAKLTFLLFAILLSPQSKNEK